MSHNRDIFINFSTYPQKPLFDRKGESFNYVKTYLRPEQHVPKLLITFCVVEQLW